MASHSSVSVLPYTASNAVDFRDMYLKDCVSSICRWISCNGFSTSKCVNSPTEFCSKVVKDISNLKVKERSFVKRSRGMLVDMMTHLCGRVPPGIPLNLPPCTTNLEKIIQQYSTYDAILAFLRNQGAMVSGVFPESLLDYDNYLEWLEQKFKSRDVIGCKDEASFRKLSEKAWTCVLMQVVKVLVIPRLLSRHNKLQERSHLQSVKSNVYSVFEMKLLTWLNHHFKLHRDTLFGLQDSSIQARHLVHFDVDLMDSMALSCVLYSYCPFLQSTHFDKLFVEPSTPEQCAHNALIFVDALKTIGVNYDVQPSDILSPNPIFMILFCAHLYSILVTYKAVENVTFSTALGKSSEAKISISNSSSRSVEYLVLVRGDGQQHFTCSSSLSITRQSSKDLTVTYHCHTLCFKEANLLLVSVNRHPSVATKSYSLHGSCTGAVPRLHKRISTHLYELTSIDLPLNEVVQPLDGNFKIKLIETNSTSLQNRQDSNSPLFVSSSSLQSRTKDKFKLFHCDQSSISASSTLLQVEFIGLMMGSRQCFVLVSSSEQPDLVFSIVAEVKQPLPMLPSVAGHDQHTIIDSKTNTLHLSACAGRAVLEDIIIYPSNVSFENALIQLTKWELSEKELKQRVLTGSLQYAALSSDLSRLCVEDVVKNERDETVLFTIEGTDTQHFSLPPVVNVSTNGHTKFPVHFMCESEGQFECHVLMRSGHDVRLFVVEATVLSKENLAQIEFKTHAILPLTQNVPVINPSTSDWILQAAISNTQFSGPDIFRVDALTTSCYPLTFHPRKEGKIGGKLTLVNTKDLSDHTFDLVGIAERPLAQESISLQAKVKQRLTHLIHVPNYMDRTITFRVESDLDFISGPSEVVVGGDDIVDCRITILPKRRGMFSGALVFMAKDNSISSFSKESAYHIWYKVDCEVEPCAAVETISATCPVMSSRLVQLKIPDTANQAMDLSVTIECDYLSGPATCAVTASQDFTYSMTFSPLSVGACNGRIIFDSSAEGEFWYELCFEALNPEVIHMPLLECEVGRSCRQVLALRNPLDREVSFTCSNPNTRHYSVAGLAQGTINVAAHSQVNVTILFYPSTLGSIGHDMDLTFSSYELGKQVFAVHGTGIMPSKLDTTVIKSTVNSSAAHTISFVNPLKSSTSLHLALQGKDSSHFSLLTRLSNKSVIIQEGESIDIALVFAPEEMYTHEVVFSLSTTVKCTCDSCESGCVEMHQLTWEYPVVGQPQVLVRPEGNALTINCHAMKPFEQVMVVHLKKSSKGSNARFIRSQVADVLSTKPCSSEKYSISMECDDESLLSVVNQYLKVHLLGECDDGDTSGDTAHASLVFKIIFSPPKAFSGPCNVRICTSEGGLWILPLQLCALSAYPDDIITIESAGLNVVAQTSFRLTSTSLDSVPFTAHFMCGSDPEISVTPTNGILSPSNTRGTQFVISYKPIMYGKRHCAKFVVQCDVAEWCYEIIGKLPNVKYTHSHPIAMEQHKPISSSSNEHKRIIRQTI